MRIPHKITPPPPKKKDKRMMKMRDALTVIAALITCACCITTIAAAAVTLDDLPATVAMVNGAPVKKSAVVPTPDEAVADAVRRAVDDELIVQQFAKEGFDKDPRYESEMKWLQQQQALADSMVDEILSRYYEQ